MDVDGPAYTPEGEIGVMQLPDLLCDETVPPMPRPMTPMGVTQGPPFLPPEDLSFRVQMLADGVASLQALIAQFMSDVKDEVRKNTEATQAIYQSVIGNAVGNMPNAVTRFLRFIYERCLYHWDGVRFAQGVWVDKFNDYNNATFSPYRDKETSGDPTLELFVLIHLPSAVYLYSKCLPVEYERTMKEIEPIGKLKTYLYHNLCVDSGVSALMYRRSAVTSAFEVVELLPGCKRANITNYASDFALVPAKLFFTVCKQVPPLDNLWALIGRLRYETCLTEFLTVARDRSNRLSEAERSSMSPYERVIYPARARAARVGDFKENWMRGLGMPTSEPELRKLRITYQALLYVDALVRDEEMVKLPSTPFGLLYCPIAKRLTAGVASQYLTERLSEQFYKSKVRFDGYKWERLFSYTGPTHISDPQPQPQPLAEHNG